MRQINKFKYFNKFFTCWDLLVEDYYNMLLDPKGTLEKILMEFNKTLPTMNYRQNVKFQLILLWRDEELNDFDSFMKKMDNDKKNNKGNDQMIEDFHVRVLSLWRLGQPYDTVMKIPYLVFIKALKDFEVIAGTKEYDPKRHSQRLDSKWLKALVGWISEIKHLS